MRSWISSFLKINFNKENFVKIIKKLTVMVGTLYTLCTFIDDIQIIDRNLVELFSENFYKILIVSLICSIISIMNFTLSYKMKIKDTDAYITLKIGDIVKSKESLVISTNTSFVTTLENGVISVKSVQGAFQEKFYKNNLETLNREINASLKFSKYQPIGALTVNKRKYNTYKIGTVAKINNANRKVYFTALNDINEYGKPINLHGDELIKTIGELLEFMKKQGHIEPLAIPLIGSGKLGDQKYSRNRVLMELIDAFVCSATNDKICDNIIIYILPEDFEFVDLKKIKAYINYKCNFNL